MRFFEGLGLKEFMNTHQEWHAFWEGLTETFCFWKPRQKLTGNLKKELEAEHHYYMVGRAVGFIGLALFGVWIVKLLRRK